MIEYNDDNILNRLNKVEYYYESTNNIKMIKYFNNDNDNE